MPKKKSPTKTVNVDAVKRDVAKMTKEYSPKPSGHGNFTSGGFGEVAPGSVKRQSPLEQDMGSKKYREMIHNHNEKNKLALDKLPFTFPKKKIVRSHLDVLLECPECATPHVGTENTVGFVCKSCHKYVSAKNPEAESRGYDPELKVGIHGTAADRLRKKEELAKKRANKP